MSAHLSAVPMTSEVERAVQAVYDNNGVTVDRFTIVFTDSEGSYRYLRASVDQDPMRGVLDAFNGKPPLYDDRKIAWSGLPETVRQSAWRAIRDINLQSV